MNLKCEACYYFKWIKDTFRESTVNMYDVITECEHHFNIMITFEVYCEIMNKMNVHYEYVEV